MMSTAEIVFILIIILYLVILPILVHSMLNFIFSIIDEIRFQRAKKSFFKKLRNKMKYGIVKSLEDVTLIQSSIAKKRRFYPFESRNTDFLLEEYLTHLPDKDRKNFKLVKSLINQARAETPFSILPKKERMIAKELKKRIKNMVKDEVLSNSFEELVVSLGTRLRDANAERDKTRKSARLSVILGIIAIVVGVISILIYLVK